MAENKGTIPNIPVISDPGYPFDRVRQIRPGVRYSQRDFPGNGRFSVPSPADKSAGAGTIHDYDSMGKVATPTVAKNLKGGR